MGRYMHCKNGNINEMVQDCCHYRHLQVIQGFFTCDIYPPSERSETGRDYILTFVCVSVHTQSSQAKPRFELGAFRL